MNPRSHFLPDPVRVRPLLRAIARELRERLAVARRLEARLTLAWTGGRWSDAALELRAELARERAALLRIERELADLGWSHEEHGNAIRLVHRLPRGLETLSYEPERTGFWPRPERTPA